MNEIDALSYLPSFAIIIGTGVVSGLVHKNIDKIIDVLGNHIPVKGDSRIVINHNNSHRSDMTLNSNNLPTL